MTARDDLIDGIIGSRLLNGNTYDRSVAIEVCEGAYRSQTLQTVNTTSPRLPLKSGGKAQMSRFILTAGSVFMRQLVKALAICVPLVVLPGAAGAKGCIKGAIVGGILGHYARHHALLGAAAGCVIEHEREKALRDEKRRVEERTAPAYLAPPRPPLAAPPNAHPNLPPPSPLI